MNKKLILLIGFVFLANLFVFAQQDTTVKIVAPKKELNYDYMGACRLYISLGLGVNIIGDKPLFNGKFDFGVFVKPKHLLFLELGGGMFNDQKIGTFTYTDGSGKYHDDGKINYKYTNFMVFVSYNYVLKLSKSVQWRVGPSIGIMEMSAGFDFNPSGLKGAPGAQTKSITAFAFGANTGFTFNFSKNKRWFLDLNWKIYGNTGISFEKRSLILEGYTIPIGAKKFSYLGNQINLSIGWRFCKVKVKN